MSAECQRAKQWLSASRDGEALDDPDARTHLDGCPECAAWAATLDAVLPRLRLRPAGSPDVVSAALAAWPGRLRSRQLLVGRAVLAIAGLAGIVLAALQLALAGDHVARELAMFEAAVALGFLLAAWRPAQYGRALLPLVAAAGLLTLVVAAPDVLRVDLVQELPHIALLLGLLGLLLAGDRQDRSA